MKLTEELRETIEETKQNSAGDNATIIANSFFKSVLGLVPVVGDTAMEIYEELQSRQVKRKIKRLENFYHELDDKINSLQDKVNQDYLSQDDFLDVFERSTRYVVLERHERKRQLFANILTNSVTESVCDYDKTERYFRLLDNLTELEL